MYGPGGNKFVCFDSLTSALAQNPEIYGHLDLIAFGFPCQDISNANPKGKGLAGSRSSIFFECMRIVNLLNPAWVLIENVPRLLSINQGRDMAIVLQTLAQSGYGWAYRLLDSRYFGLAQRRKRVFIVGCFGRLCPPEVLFEPKGRGRDDKAKPEIRSRGLCLHTPRGRCDPSFETYVASTIQATDYQKVQHGQFGNENNLICRTIEAEKLGYQSHSPVIACTIQATDKKLRKFGFGENLVGNTVTAKSYGDKGWALHQEFNSVVAQTLGAGQRGVAGRIWEDTHIAEINPDRKGAPAGISLELDSCRGFVLGNAVSVPVAQWLGQRIIKYVKGER